MNRGARLGSRGARACTCGATNGEHAFGCPQRPRRGQVEKQRTRMRQERATPRRSARKEDPEFVRLVHLLPCCARRIDGHRCSGPIQAHHAGSKHDHGAGALADDDTAIPLCEGAHRDLEDAVGSVSGRGTFAKWSGPQRMAWEQVQISETRPKVERLRKVPGPRSEEEAGL